MCVDQTAVLSPIDALPSSLVFRSAPSSTAILLLLPNDKPRMGPNHTRSRRKRDEKQRGVNCVLTSEAMSSRPENCLQVSFSMSSATSGSCSSIDWYSDAFYHHPNQSKKRKRKENRQVSLSA